MSKVLITEKHLEDIADAIREKLGSAETYKPGEMAEAIESIESYPEPTGTKSITVNGTHNVKDYASAAVNVPNTYAAADEGKVVQNAALVAQTARAAEITANGTYDTTTNDEVTVNVSGGGYPEPTGTIAITQNGTHDVKDYASANVNVSGGILTGTTPPTSDIGSDGDYYKQTFPIASGVSFVEYLESTGTQYIDTGIYVTGDIDVYVKFGITQSGNYSVLGARTGGYSNLSKGLFIAFNTSQNKVFGGKTSSAINGDTIGYLASTIGATYEYVTVSQHINGASNFNFIAKLNEKTTLHRPDQTDFTSVNTLTLFAMHVDNTISKGASGIYRATIYKDGVPIADYIPALDGNGVACMWDNVAQEYAYNDGTGDFLYGSAATPDPLDPVLYVKESGAWTVI